MLSLLRTITTNDLRGSVMTRESMQAGLPAALTLVAMICPSPAHPETSDNSFDTIVVTASRLGRPAAELTQSIDIIDASDIEARQPASFTGLMRQLPGINVIQQGGRGSVTSLIVRGGEPNFTVILIDGVKVNDSMNTRGGSYDFSYLDLAAIERIEIVRGPMSALYGSDALAGVVNIITNRSHSTSRATVTTGGDGRTAGSVALDGRFRDLVADFSAHATEEDGDIKGADYSDVGLGGRLRLPLGGNGETGVLWRLQDAESTTFPEDSGGPELAVIRDVDERKVREAHARAWLTFPVGRAWSSSASLSRYDREESSRSPGIAAGVFDGVPPVETDTDFVRDQLVVSFAGAVSESASLVIGGEWQHEDGQSAGTIDFGAPVPTDFRIDRDTLSTFAEAEWRLHPVVVQASVRRDDPDEIDAETSTKLGLLYELPGTAGDLRLSWGEAFKAPSFFALAHPLVGNSDLVSETASSVDLGYRAKRGDTATLEFSVFHSEYQNLIDFDPERFTNVNRSRVVVQGVEAGGSVVINQALDIEAHLTYMDTDVRESNARLRGRPNWRGGLVTNWKINDAWRLTASLLALDQVYDSSIPTGSVLLDSYQRLDLAVSYHHDEALRFGFAIDNALDERYYEAVGFPAAGIRARLNARYTF